MKKWLESRWYSDRPAPWLLRPLAVVYGWIAARRRKRLTATAAKLSVPVIVVGNISVGGTGKTPFVIWLVEQLRSNGFKPGIVSRGYGGRAPEYPYEVTEHTDAAVSGDEPLLLAQRLQVPVVVAPDRLAAARELLARHEAVDVLVADDGLQHYRLARDLEFCVVDAARGLGNGALLPAGPLRESPARLHEVDGVIVNGGGWRGAGRAHADMTLAMTTVISFGGRAQPLSAYVGQRVHAVAGIGRPERFFEQLHSFGIKVIPHAFADHHVYTLADLQFGDSLPLLMTEKDAVKCRGFAQRHWIYVPVTAQLDANGAALVRKLCEGLRR
ncbi:MAG: tetraacyldisaccharide 4'-kinase [Stenotrophobium sp.]